MACPLKLLFLLLFHCDRLPWLPWEPEEGWQLESSSKPTRRRSHLYSECDAQATYNYENYENVSVIFFNLTIEYDAASEDGPVQESWQWQWGEDGLPALVNGAGSFIHLSAASHTYFPVFSGCNSAVGQAETDWEFLSMFTCCYVRFFSFVAITYCTSMFLPLPNSSYDLCPSVHVTFALRAHGCVFLCSRWLVYIWCDFIWLLVLDGSSVICHQLSVTFKILSWKLKSSKTWRTENKTST